MSKFRVIVCLPPSAISDVDAALTTAMAPFDMNRPWDGNEDAEWDWWEIDTAEVNLFAVKPEHDGDPRLIYGRHARRPLRCDGGPRGLLDFEATRQEAIARSRAQWEAEQRDFRRLVADHPEAQPLTAFLARHAADPEAYPRDQAVADHHAQPLVRALNHISARDRYPTLGMWVLGPKTDPITRFTQDPQAGFDSVAAWAIPETALLTLDGQWIDADRLGPFTDVRDGEPISTSYARQATAYLDALDDGCVIVRLRCHC